MTHSLQTSTSTQPRRALCAALAVVLCAMAAPPVQAQGDTAEQAEAFYLQAVQLFNEGRYREALDNFDRAIALAPEPVFYCNRAAVLLKLSEQTLALESMETCLAGFEAFDEETAQEKAQIAAEVGALQAAVRVVRPDAQAVATQIATRPTPGGEVIIIEAPDDGPSVTTIAAWSTAILGGGALATAIIMDQVTLPLIDEYRQAGREGQDQDRYDALRTAIDQRKVVIGALLIVGTVSAVTSGLLFWADASAEDAPPTSGAQADVWLIPGGAAIGVGVDF